jgi:hypothetical protein
MKFTKIIDFMRNFFNKEKVISIRKSTFETNSSSTHSLVLAEEKNMVSPEGFSHKLSLNDDYEEYPTHWQQKMTFILGNLKEELNLPLLLLDDKDENLSEDVKVTNYITNTVNIQPYIDIIKEVYKEYTGHDLIITGTFEELSFSSDNGSNVVYEMFTVIHAIQNSTDNMRQAIKTVFRDVIFDENISVAVIDEDGIFHGNEKFKEYYNASDGSIKLKFWRSKGWIK